MGHVLDIIFGALKVFCHLRSKIDIWDVAFLLNFDKKTSIRPNICIFHLWKEGINHFYRFQPAENHTYLRLSFNCSRHQLIRSAVDCRRPTALVIFSFGSEWFLYFLILSFLSWECPRILMIEVLHESYNMTYLFDTIHIIY